MTQTAVFDGRKLWDEILKAIVDTMPEQLFPLFREIYGKEYPEGTSIVLLETETSTFWEDKKKAPRSTFMDIALLVGGTDYYHLECQMKNDHEMVIRMFAYDVHFAITHTKAMDGDTGEITLKFPRSFVIYPEGIRAVPDHLQCRVIFQDNSEHIYQIPTVKVQSYSLKEIKEKHLILFLPYTMLRFRSRLRRKKEITEKELTEYLEEVILILEEEVSAGGLTELQYHDYVRLIRHAAERVFVKHRELWKEIDKMTKPLIKLPSVEIRELKEELAEQKKEFAKQKEEFAKQKAELAKQKVENDKQKAENARQATELAEQKAEVRRLQEMLRLAQTN
ncbi:MAG: hypothetical protein K2K20_06485 [Lachnospiraceae bacterium]|nr:hypothetical protein [Lachnospiraceae bacterium]